ncbi:MAG: NAD(P)/FAD-dependent oxidoreductase [Leptospiraceae bacterium]|nr:NAD(P)/FAD-dependent oxidoreductase [Leptospiraceae bacterium]MCP5499981.1 NAD(P)/FAD-dependent oxidoreductase [Leptospiraceae bacterium]
MNTSEQIQNYDIIFIGSGIGSLTAASLLAQFKDKKILILEKHFQPGGFTHEFQRRQNKYSWDVGIHYIGDLAEGSFLKRIFDVITGNKLQWQKMSEPFEKFVYPDKTFSVYGEPEKYISDLIKEFPEEEVAIRQYFKDVQKVSIHIGKYTMLRNSAPSLDSISKLVSPDGSIRTLKDYYDTHFKSDRLKGILTSQWGNYGLPPHLASFAIHAQVVQHYMNGGYFPVGGSGNIFKFIEPIIEEKGGKVLSSHEVEEVLIEQNKAIGVKVKLLRGENRGSYTNFYAPVIVSDTGAYSSYLKLIPQSYPIAFREDLRKFFNAQTFTVSSVTAYIGLSDDPRKLGFNGENHWIYSSYEHDKVVTEKKNWYEEGGEPPVAYLSFPSLKNPEAKSHTADIITFMDYEVFARWKDLPWKKRGEEYESLKKIIADKLIQVVDTKYPGFKDMIEYVELSTPLSNEHFTSHVKGTIYGLPCVPERYQKEKTPWFEVKTPLEGFYLTGTDTSSPGVSGALMGGLSTANVLLGKDNIVKLISKKA